jgi:hypothetical protein
LTIESDSLQPSGERAMHVKNCVSGFTIAALTLILAIAPSWESAQARMRAD